MDFYVQYRDFEDGRDYDSRHGASREIALGTACDLIRKHHTVHRIVGPDGVCVERSDILAWCKLQPPSRG